MTPRSMNKHQFDAYKTNVRQQNLQAAVDEIQNGSFRGGYIRPYWTLSQPLKFEINVDRAKRTR